MARAADEWVWQNKVSEKLVFVEVLKAKFRVKRANFEVWKAKFWVKRANFEVWKAKFEVGGAIAIQSWGLRLGCLVDAKVLEDLRFNKEPVGFRFTAPNLQWSWSMLKCLLQARRLTLPGLKTRGFLVRRLAIT